MLFREALLRCVQRGSVKIYDTRSAREMPSIIDYSTVPDIITAIMIVIDNFPSL